MCEYFSSMVYNAISKWCIEVVIFAGGNHAEAIHRLHCFFTIEGC